MKIAVEGCCHGELDKIYQTVAQLESRNRMKIDLLIICGDFQSVRNMDDLQAMAVPQKYQKLNTFYKYYSGEKVAPILTIFIGGNHEASNYLQELPYGGWVARNIYYLGYAGVIQVGGVRIGGISGIYKGHDFNKGHFECPPYDDSSKRSVYHVRNLEVFRLKQMSRHLDIFVSHDWPTGVYNYGDVGGLLRAKPFFKKEVEENTLGSKPCADLLSHLQPSYWFAAHLHVKFAALVQHQPSNGDTVGQAKSTKFLALDKCLPRKRFLQVLDIPHNEQEGLRIKLDPEWLRILQTTNHLLNTTHCMRYMPGPNGNERHDFTVAEEEMSDVVEVFGGDMTLPENFVATAPAFTGNPHQTRHHQPMPLVTLVNPQTTLLCTMLDLTDPNAKALGKTSEELLEESAIGLPQPDNEDGNHTDDDDDHHGDDCDGNPTADTTFNPSFIDSSMDMSQSFGAADTSANAATSSLFSIPVADDDEELLSILSVQKSKSVPANVSYTATTLTESSSTSSPSSSMSSTHLSKSSTLSSVASSSPSKKLSVADRLRALNAREQRQTPLCGSSEVSSNSVSTTDTPMSTGDVRPSCFPLQSSDSSVLLRRSDTLDCSDVESHSQLESRCSPTQSVANRECDGSGSRSPQTTSTSGGGSGRLNVSCSSATVSSSSSLIGSTSDVSPPQKRDSSDLDSTQESPSGRSQVTSSSGSGVKKLKRRNVSLYQEASE